MSGAGDAPGSSLHIRLSEVAEAAAATPYKVPIIEQSSIHGLSTILVAVLLLPRWHLFGHRSGPQTKSQANLVDAWMVLSLVTEGAGCLAVPHMLLLAQDCQPASKVPSTTTGAACAKQR